MDSRDIAAAFERLTTPHIADGALRTGTPIRLGPPGLACRAGAARLAGRVVPARHVGSVDVFLEAFGTAQRGDVLVVDNAGRRDEACVGDLTILEARAAGLAGMIVWGLHRDTPELVRIGFPVFSLGTLPCGPRRLDARPADALDRAYVGEAVVTRDDAVFADADGTVFLPASALDRVLAAAEKIANTERKQAEYVADGTTLREQFRFDDFLARRAQNPSYTFRDHLTAIGAAIEV
jgi:regulator of RNase E activity RraA